MKMAARSIYSALTTRSPVILAIPSYWPSILKPVMSFVVAPFGGDAWVEIYDPHTGDQVWSTAAPADVPTNDAKAIHSLDEGRILIQGGKDDHALIAIYAVP